MADIQTPTEASLLSSSAEPLQKDAAAQVEIKTNGVLSEEPALFSQSLISPEVTAMLPEGYTIRPLRRSDYHGGMWSTFSHWLLSRGIDLILLGFLDTLRVLTTVGEPTIEEFNTRYDFLASRNDTYYVLVICDSTGTIVGTGAVIVERKFIHNMGLVGHIEDIAVAKNQQGKKLGLRIIQALDHVASAVGCYKSILDCSEANEGFYVKCGFKRAGLEMAHYYWIPSRKNYEIRR